MKNNAKEGSYKSLNQLERDRIEALLDFGCSQKEIAEILERDKGTISREIKRGSKKTGKYIASDAQHKAYVRRKYGYTRYQGKKIEQNDQLRLFIVLGLIAGWNPNEISGRMKELKAPFYASKTAIYEWLYSSAYGEKYCCLLASKRHKKKKQKENKTKREMIKNRRWIDEKPSNYGEKAGDFEVDTIVSGKKTGSTVAIVGVVDIHSKLIRLRKIDSLKPELNEIVIQDILSGFLVANALVRDSGIENKNHEQTATPSFFCHPYSPWEKPHIENENKGLRRYFPKGCDLSKYSQEYISQVEWRLNNKPRKSLGYKNPIEVAIESGLIRDQRSNNNQLLMLNNCPLVALRG